MDTNNLKRDISTLQRCEKTRSIIEQLDKALEERETSLGIPSEKPELQEYTLESVGKRVTVQMITTVSLRVALIVFAIAFSIPFFLTFDDYIFPVLGEIYAVTDCLIFASLVGSIVLMLLFTIGGIAHIFMNKRSARILVTEKTAENEKIMSDFSESETLRLAFEEKMKKRIMGDRTALCTLKKLGDDTVSELYDRLAFAEKYRGDITAVTMICEYISDGRCESLHSDDGAYALFEQELKNKKIIRKFGTMFNKLELIEKTQPLLYETMTEISDTVETLKNACLCNAEAVDSGSNNTKLADFISVAHEDFILATKK